MRAVDDECDIINFSSGHLPRDIGGPPPVLWSSTLRLLEEAFCVAASKGVLCVAAAGNSGPFLGSIATPARLSEVLAVASVDQHGRVSNNSSRGPVRISNALRPGEARRWDSALDTDVILVSKPDIAVRGEQMVAARTSLTLEESPLLDPEYTTMSGTSQACAVATGIAACTLEAIRSKGMPLDVPQNQAVAQVLKKSAIPLSKSTPEDHGHGTLYWSNIVALINDCVSSAGTRRAVLHDVDLKILD
jgi:subtilisin family serine protease